MVNARIDVHLPRWNDTARRSSAPAPDSDAGADCVYPIGVADEATIAALVELGTPVNVLLRPGAPPISRLAELGVARVSLGHFLHAEMTQALEARLERLNPHCSLTKPSRRGTILLATL